MNSYTSRMNTLGTHAMTSLAVLAGALVVVSLVPITSQPEVKIGVDEIKSLQVSWRERKDHALLRFSLKADLRPLINWNVNGLYVSLIAEYETEMHDRNEVVIWDSVIRQKEDVIIGKGKIQPGANIDKKGELVKYLFKDYSRNLRGRDVSLRLQYVIMPYVGAMRTFTSGKYQFTMPEAYTS